MVKFGEKLEESKQGKWAHHYADYAKLKEVLEAAQRAHERREEVVGSFNFGGSHGLLDALKDKNSVVKSPMLTKGLTSSERERLIALYMGDLSRSLRQETSYAALLQQFDVMIALEFEKVERHYREQVELMNLKWAHHTREDLSAAFRRRRSISYDEEEHHQTPPPSSSEHHQLRRRSSSTLPAMTEVEKSSLKRALSHLFDDAIELRDFSTWNCTALSKICKKRDKLFGKEPSIRKAVCGSKEVLALQSASEVRKVTEEIRQEFAEYFCDGDTAEADWQLREYCQDPWSFEYSRDAMRLGYRAGVAAMLAVWVLWDCVEVVDGKGSHTKESVASKPAWPVFRLCGELVAWHWMWGLSLQVWSEHRVNVDFLFDSEDRSPAAYEVYDEAAMETIVLLTMLLVYYKATYHRGLPTCVTNYVAPSTVAAYAPLATLAFAVYRLLTPWSRRKHLWHSLGRVFVAPCVPVKFVDTYVADVLSSMVKVVQDALWAVCYFGTGDFTATKGPRTLLQSCSGSVVMTRLVTPAVCLFPVWLRFAQCLKKHHDLGDDSARTKIHLANAAKYALSMLVSLSSALREEAITRLWLFVFCVSSAYSWAWDVGVDWGVPSLYDHKRARLYPHKWWYYCALVLDFGGRFVWLATLIPPSALAKRLELYIPEYLVPMLALAELSRRCLWGLFRLEHEHVSNAFRNRPDGQFVPSHFRRAPPSEKRESTSRAQAYIETLAIATLVITLLYRVSVTASKSASLDPTIGPYIPDRDDEDDYISRYRNVSRFMGDDDDDGRS